ncbi:hypothetical protein C2S53_006444 [Perilla frutescens var. hirtella]|uniref:Cytochrome P450 n=1 Tax=Perilla frutescens var. hirtella TaxID=608512 RepID=A0AAD4JF89_PERFH|nr:hypothetical protein C2S53_006444 [Perilla frutescens var. hirtella]
MSKNPPKNLVPPGPRGLPLIGNLVEIASASNLPIYLWQLSKKYGPVMLMKIGRVPILVVSSSKLAKEMMKTQDLAFCGRPSLLGQKKMTYNCSDMVFSPYGDYWREVRKITAVHLFSLKKNQSFRPIREDEISRVIAKILSFSHVSSDIQVVNLSDIALALGSTLISRIAFGERYGSEMHRLDVLVREVQAVLTTFYVSDYFPWFGWFDKLSGSINRLNRVFNNLDSFYEEMIDEHLDPKRVKKVEEEDDILDILIKIKEQASCSIDLDSNRIKALLTDIFIGATDTSAASTVWTMTALIKAPNVMEKLKSQIRNLVGKKGRVDEDDLAKLPYLNAVINEALRLYPPAPLLVPRETIERCSLAGYEIQPKTVVYVNAWAIARDPEHWKNPDAFVPERFLNSNIDIKGQDFEVIPFGSGRRMCPGIPMGLANVELTVANLLYSFDWELPPGIRAEDIDTDALPGITMHKKNPLLLVAKKYVA